MLKTYFVKQGIKEAEIGSFIRTAFPIGDYSRIDLQRTPLGIKVVIYTNKPGRIIGKGGKNIEEILAALRKRFSLENPQLDIKGIEQPDLDAQIVAKQIASALEKGYNHKKIGNLTLKRVMDAGAAGAEIVIAGKVGGTKGSTTKFVAGYLKHCGEQAYRLVDHGFEEALTKPGKIGIKVAIMKTFEDITGQIRDVRSPTSILPPEIEEALPPDAPPEKPKKARAKAAPKRAETGGAPRTAKRAHPSPAAGKEPSDPAQTQGAGQRGDGAAQEPAGKREAAEQKEAGGAAPEAAAPAAKKKQDSQPAQEPA